MKLRLFAFLISIIVFSLSSLLISRLVVQGLQKFNSSNLTKNVDKSVFFNSAPLAFSCNNVTEITLIECNALVTLYNSTNGPNWSDHTGWLNTTTPCSWYGITACNNKHVTEIRLGTNNLSGSLPSNLSNLNNLNHLDLFSNQISGAIPPELGNLTNLQVLGLQSNQLNGNIPSQLSNLSQLQILDLSYNQLSGNIPVQLGNLSQLQTLNLANNNLSGSIPTQLGKLTFLDGFDLSFNQVNGSIPTELGNLSNLRFLVLANNQLSGAIPAQLGNLVKLQVLRLGYNNYLNGNIPTQLGNLTQLNELNLSSNQLEGIIPTELGNLINLQALELSRNRLSGNIPSEFGHLTNLQYLLLQKNQLSGEIPPQLVNLTGLQELDLGYNLFTSSDASLHNFLLVKDANWADTQTIAPMSIHANVQSISTVRLTWLPISYTADIGYYEINYAISVNGPYRAYGVTSDKSSNNFTLNGLFPATTYYFRMRTYTRAHADQKNELWSDSSPVITATTAPICYTLYLSHTGAGGDPIPTPANSTGCPVGTYVTDETINLNASPANGWQVSGWNGTTNDSSTANSNSLTMPLGTHTVIVIYNCQTRGEMSAEPRSRKC